MLAERAWPKLILGLLDQPIEIVVALIDGLALQPRNRLNKPALNMQPCGIGVFAVGKGR
ncbi:MAG: hypothetical protein HC870_02840 [Rhizobiales bacterium]|nr:hypothetical protein [Hyphomicrobiales bacterium]